jgi:hypothetical protein
LSLSQNLKTTGANCRSSAWRARTGPPEGAFDRLTFRPPLALVRDRRIHLHPPFTIASDPNLPGSARWRIVVERTFVWAGSLWVRHTLEDGVANAEAPSSNEGLIRRVFEFVRRSLASARFGLAVCFPVAPKTNSTSEYDLTGQ